jgi:hypothetical protein
MHQIDNPTYGDLFKHLEEQVYDSGMLIMDRTGAEAFTFTKKFLHANGVNGIPRIIQILSDFGANNDLEVLINVVEFISTQLPLDFDVTTPSEHALLNDYYVRWHEGMWVRCRKDCRDAMVDTNRAVKEIKNRYKGDYDNGKDKKG